MAQLLSGVSSTAHYWPVDEIPESDYVRCDDEVARVLVRHPTRQQIRVERGVEGTAAASHAADAEVSAAYVVGTDGGGEQTIRLLGPYPITFETPNLDGAGARLVDVDEGSWLIQVMWVRKVSWQATPVPVSAFSGFVTFGGPDGLGADGGLFTENVASLNSPSAAASAPLLMGADKSAPWDSFTAVGMADTGGGLYVALYPDNAFTQGEADIYALIAEPV